MCAVMTSASNWNDLSKWPSAETGQQVHKSSTNTFSSEPGNESLVLFLALTSHRLAGWAHGNQSISQIFSLPICTMELIADINCQWISLDTGKLLLHSFILPINILRRPSMYQTLILPGPPDPVLIFVPMDRLSEDYWFPRSTHQRHPADPTVPYVTAVVCTPPMT